MDIKKNKIAILRGGQKDYFRSMKNGASAVLSLGRYGDMVDVIDVVLDEKNNWFEKGILSDAHRVFSRVDYYIDLTSNKNLDYHHLSKKLNVKEVFESRFVSNLNRINTRRILEQIRLDMPRYIVIREKENLSQKLKDIWSKFHTPLVIKESDHHFNKKSFLTYSFTDTLKKINDILGAGGEALLEEHVSGKYISVVAIPDYRGEDIYVSTPVEIINLEAKNRILGDKVIKEKYLIDHSHEKRSLIHINENIKKDIKNIISDIYKILLIDRHALIDLALIEDKDNKNDFNIKVLDIHTNPNIFEDSRFDFILQNSGIDLGKFILDRIEKMEEEDLVY